MKKKITISIGIPAYNEEKNIYQLLNSIINQSQTSFVIREVIVISDGSTDGTVKIINQINNPLIKCIDGRKRLGQNKRQNQLVKLFSKTSDYYSIVEADTLPSNKYFLNLISKIPKNDQFSIIVGSSEPLPAITFFGKIMNLGFYMRRDFFEKCLHTPNVYLFAESGLISRKFLRTIKWHEKYNEDSYLFRLAINSNLPIIRSKKAIKYFKSVENLYDYLLQSGKFQKARQNESRVSNIYNHNLSYYKTLQIFGKYLLFHPILTLGYIFVMALSRVFIFFQPNYSTQWKIYKSSKILISKNER